MAVKIFTLFILLVSTTLFSKRWTASPVLGSEPLLPQDDSLSVRETQLWELRREAIRLGRLDKFEEAAQIYTDLIQIDPDNPDYYVNRAFFRTATLDDETNLEDLQSSIDDFKRAIQLCQEQKIPDYIPYVTPHLNSFQNHLEALKRKASDTAD